MYFFQNIKNIYINKWLLLFVLEVVSPSLVTGCIEVDVEVGLSEEDEDVEGIEVNEGEGLVDGVADRT